MSRTNIKYAGIVIALVAAAVLIGMVVVGSGQKNTTPISETVYVNNDYGFSFALPESWKGYTVTIDTWTGSKAGDQLGDVAYAKGPVVSIHNPKWSGAGTYQDIPIMVFTLAQWSDLIADKFHIGAAPVNPTELARNATYVFALPARYNYAYPTGYQEVEQILKSNPIKVFEVKGISIGAQATINGTTIGVLELLEDSRCPVDVQCIQAGTVRVRASIDSYNRDFTFTLLKPQVVGNVTVTLASVIPAQKYSKKTVQTGDYRFIFTAVPNAASKGPPVAGAGEHCGGFIQNAPICGKGYHCQLVVSRPDTGGTCVADTAGGGGILPYNSGVRGTVSLGPTCPVMRNPPDPGCADKPYSTTIQVYRTGSSSVFATGKSDDNGAFEFSLPPGTYTVAASGGTVLPRCNDENVTVGASGYATINISCDTGIR